MSKIDISLLFERPNFNITFILEITPLAPLSLVSSMPGSYYRSMREPTEYMICGMLENVIGWHFDENDGKVRSKILRKIANYYERNYGIQLEYKNKCSEVNFYPLVYHLLKFERSIIPPSFGFDDYWTQHLKGADERHMNGARNYDWRVENSVTELHQADGKARTEFFVQNVGKFPKYYASPKRREYIVTDGSYKYIISSTEKLFDCLKSALINCETAYLGSSEGWVNIKIEEIK